MRRIVRRSRLKALRRGAPDIILSHAPPAGCHDAQDPCHRGFECFQHAITVWRPSLFVHGHVHAYQRGPNTSRVGETTIMNAFPYRVITVPATGDKGMVGAAEGHIPGKAS